MEVRVPERFVGRKLEELSLMQDYQVVVLTTIKEKIKLTSWANPLLTRK